MTRQSKVPTGFVAICRCGVTVGALDYDRTDRREAGKIMGKWLADGCTVAPRFGGSWSEKISICKCTDDPEPHADYVGTIRDALKEMDKIGNSLGELLAIPGHSPVEAITAYLALQHARDILTRLPAPIDVQAKAEAVINLFADNYAPLNAMQKQELSRLIVEQFLRKG
jgi:hypothetical protein